MVRKLALTCVLAVSLLVISGTIFAHHGFAGAYDDTSRITVKATVTSMIWANPHAILNYEFKNDKGEMEEWGMEQLSPGNLVRIGWYRDTFKPGDVILVSFTTAKENRPFASCGHIFKVADNTQFITGQCGVSGGDISKLPVKPGYTAVEVEIPHFPDFGNPPGPDPYNFYGPRSAQLPK